MAKWNEAEIDEIIASVEQTVESLEKSAKGKSVAINAKANGGPMKKDEKDGKKEDEQSSDAAPDAAPSAPAEGSAAPAAADQGAPAADAAPAPSESAPEGEAPAPAEGQAGGEGELASQPELSDEELHQIYGSMPHEELERHFMIIRSLLQDAYSQDAGAGAQAPEAPAPEASAAPAAAMGKEEKKDEKKEEMEKAEKTASLERTVSEQARQIELLTKATELALRPHRKSLEGIEFIKKSDLEGGQSGSLSKSEITEKCKQLDFGKLSKSDREAINTYMLNDEGKERVEKILGVGGKN